MKPKRIQLKRTKGWRKPENTVVVSRPSKWGNPFNWKDTSPDYSEEYRKDLAKSDYANWLTRDKWDIYYPEKRQWILEHINELRGKNLACWCKPGEPCHADALLELANKE